MTPTTGNYTSRRKDVRSPFAESGREVCSTELYGTPDRKSFPISSVTMDDFPSDCTVLFQICVKYATKSEVDRC